MRRLLGSLGLLVVLALTLVAMGCGEDKGPTGKGGGSNAKGNDNVTLTQGSGCVRPGAEGFTSVISRRAGSVTVRASFSLSRAFGTRGSCSG